MLSWWLGASDNICGLDVELITAFFSKYSIIRRQSIYLFPRIICEILGIQTVILPVLYESVGTAVAQCLRCCATNRMVAASIPAVIVRFFIDIKSFRSHYGPGVDSASNRNEYQEHFLGVKAAGA